jgi:hypothetical protein
MAKTTIIMEDDGSITIESDAVLNILTEKADRVDGQAPVAGIINAGSVTTVPPAVAVAPVPGPYVPPAPPSAILPPPSPLPPNVTVAAPAAPVATEGEEPKKRRGRKSNAEKAAEAAAAAAAGTPPLPLPPVSEPTAASALERPPAGVPTPEGTVWSAERGRFEAVNGPGPDNQHPLPPPPPLTPPPSPAAPPAATINPHPANLEEFKHAVGVLNSIRPNCFWSVGQKHGWFTIESVPPEYWAYAVQEMQKPAAAA